jgi:hypothetical protein
MADNVQIIIFKYSTNCGRDIEYHPDRCLVYWLYYIIDMVILFTCDCGVEMGYEMIKHELMLCDVFLFRQVLIY